MSILQEDLWRRVKFLKAPRLNGDIKRVGQTKRAPKKVLVAQSATKVSKPWDFLTGPKLRYQLSAMELEIYVS